MTTRPPRPWLAGVLALLCSGLGHLYAGRLGAAIAVHLTSIAAAMALAAALRGGPGATAAAALAAVAVWVGQAVLAAMAARRAAAATIRAFRPVAVAAFYAATAALSYLVIPPFRAAVAHTVYVPAGSMIPTVQAGDYLAVASGHPRTLRGAVVELAAPAGSRYRDSLLKRIVAVGGDTVELRQGALWVNGAEIPREPVPGECRYFGRHADGGWREESCLDFVETLDGRAYHTYCTPGVPCGDAPPQVVPAGKVWVAGDHRDHSADSRVFGPVEERRILGEVRWVLLSWGPSGLRWDRVGQPIR